MSTIETVTGIKEYIYKRYEDGLKRYGWSAYSLEIMTDTYIDNLEEQYPLSELPLDMKGFLDVRLNDRIAELIEDEVNSYVLANDKGEAYAILQTVLDSLEIKPVIASYKKQQGPNGIPLKRFMRERCIECQFVDGIYV